MKNLTPMQAAYWTGRNATGFLGNVTSHLYVEFEGGRIDPIRLEKAVRQLHETHAMLRLRITEDGRQTIGKIEESLGFDIEDLSGLAPDAAAARLEAKRREWTGRKLDPAAGRTAAFGLSLLPGGDTRLHVDTDMVAIDPPSFCLLMEDLARFLDGGAPDDEHPAPTYFDWLTAKAAEGGLGEQQAADRRWWQGRLADIPPAPTLPSTDAPCAVESGRLAALLSVEERTSLTGIARDLRITPSALMLGLFAVVIGRATGDARYRLNVPTFWRAPAVPDVERIVGDFSNILILDIDTKPGETLGALCRRLAARMLELLGHQAYPGVSAMRDLSRQRRSLQTAPIVFTSGLDVPGGDLFSARVSRVLGSMIWAVSQGPQVALDAQVAGLDGELLINWDIRYDALPEPWIREAFDAYVTLARTVAADPSTLDRPSGWSAGDAGSPSAGQPDQRQETTMKTGLTPLQRAYLLGRETHVPLGGVAMQEVREYRGRLDLETLENRLANLAGRHDSLRTVIDPVACNAQVRDTVQVDLEVIDLSELTPDDAENRLDAHRRDFSHDLFDLSAPPWKVVAFKLPDGEDGDTCVVLFRFDALILDGFSIAALMVELFSGEPVETAPASGNTGASAPGAETVRQDAAYWKDKLQSYDGPPRLPWKQPLENIRTSRYARMGVVIDRDRFRKLTRLGAREGLFRNTVLSAVILDVLSRWLSGGPLHVGIPAAPQSGDALANRSTFFAVGWDGQRESDLSARAKALQDDVLEGLDHLAFSGIEINRLLMDRSGGVALPIVVTNGLNWPVLPLDDPMRMRGGLTTTPQVAMDIRLAMTSAGDLAIDIDHALEAIDSDVVSDILQAIDRAVARMTETGAFRIEGREILDFSHYRHNAPPQDYTAHRTLHRIATHLFTSPPVNDAIIQGDRRVSYAEMGDGVRKALSFLDTQGLEKGDVVALALPRSPEHTMITLACAFKGVIWVPVDAAAPPDRLRYMCENCTPDLVVGNLFLDGLKTVATETVFAPDAFADASAAASSAASADPSTPALQDLSCGTDAAFYLYTSGTTGKPKCVVLSNRAADNVIGSTNAEWCVTGEDVFFSVSPLHHDMSVYEVFGCLAAGATLVQPAPGEEKDALRWNQLVRQHGVTIWSSVPTILEMLLSCRRGGELASLRVVNQGGDYLKPSVIADLRRSNPDALLSSVGGPTETTVWSIWHRIGPEDTGAIPYGRPLPANRYFVLDEHGDHCPPGVVGRIHSSGVNTALGYLENGVLHQQDFIEIEDETGETVRAFRSGDRGRYRRDGTILFDSRVQGYIKVRGVRISIPDVENELVKHPEISRVLLTDLGDERQGETELGLLYEPVPGSALTDAQVRAFARRHLQESHVPSRLMRVESIPLSANGKPDRRQARLILTGPPLAQNSIASGRPLPENGKVLDIYREVLGLDADHTVDGVTDFLSMGLLPSHLRSIAARLNAAFGTSLLPKQLLPCRNAEQVQTLIAGHNA